MKKVLLIIGLNLFLLNLNAQQSVLKSVSPNEQQRTEVLEEVAKVHESVLAALDEYVLDSVIYYNFLSETDSVLFAKKEYIRYENSDYDRIEYSWDDALNSWIDSLKTELKFDENDNLIEYIRSDWDLESGVWVVKKKIEETYNEAGLEIFFIYYKWDDDLQELANYYKEEYEYDENGNMTLIISWLWNGDTEEWEGSMWYEVTYTATNKIGQSITSFWEAGPGNWEYVNKDVYDYGINDFLVLKKQYDWDENTSTWDYHLKSDYANNDLGDPEIIIDSYSHDSGSTWTVSSKSEYTYNDANELILRIGFWWNEDTGEWEYNYKDEYGWDNFGNRILHNSFMWDEEIPDWKLMFMTEDIYNEAGKRLMSAWYHYDNDQGMLIGDFKHLYELNEGGVYNVSFEYFWDIALNDWVLDNKGYYYYSINIGINNQQEYSFEIYPNPATHFLSVHLKDAQSGSYSIYSLAGSLLSEGSITHQTEIIDISPLPNGFYLLTFDDGKEVYSQRFLKIR